MPGAWFFRSNSPPGDGAQHHAPGPVGRHLNPVLLSFSRRACVHPIYTIVSVAILASTTYLGLLESSLFDHHISPTHAVGRVDFNNLLSGSKNLYAGPDTAWKWTAEQAQISDSADDVSYIFPRYFPCSAIDLLFFRTSPSSLWSSPIRPPAPPLLMPTRSISPPIYQQNYCHALQIASLPYPTTPPWPSPCPLPKPQSFCPPSRNCPYLAIHPKLDMMSKKALWRRRSGS
jgi:hypothetical protein